MGFNFHIFVEVRSASVRSVLCERVITKLFSHPTEEFLVPYSETTNLHIIPLSAYFVYLWENQG